MVKQIKYNRIKREVLNYISGLVPEKIGHIIWYYRKGDKEPYLFYINHHFKTIVITSEDLIYFSDEVVRYIINDYYKLDNYSVDLTSIP